MNRTDDDAMTDGGQPTRDNVLDELPEPSSDPLPRSVRMSQLVDEYILAPGRIAWADWRARVGIIILVAFALMGTVGVMIVPEPSSVQAEPYLAPFQNWRFPLGANGFGEGQARQLIHATPAMFKMIIAGAFISIAGATVIGITAGYKGGRIDEVLMMVTDIVMTIPALPLIVVLAAVFDVGSPITVGILLGIDNWPGLARALRSQTLTIREESYIEAARTMDISNTRILGQHVTPQLLPYILINAATSARAIIFESVGLYFLGILPFSVFNWGVMMNFARADGALSTASRRHALFIPMIVIFLLSLGLILFSQGMDRIVNPRLRARHMKSVDTDDDDEAAAEA